MVQHDKPGYVYVLQMEGHPYYKIGRTVNLTRRVSQISPQMPGKLELVKARHVGNCEWAETNLHKEFKDRRLNGEWFLLDRECLEIVEAALLLCQANSLLSRLLSSLGEAHSDMCHISIECYGRIISRAARRCRRRLDTILNLSSSRQKLESGTCDPVLDAEIVL